MAALTDNRVTESKNRGAIKSYPAGVDIIYAGSLVMIDSNGYALPAQASASNKGVVGVAVAKVDNSGGSAGDLSVLVQEGWFKFAGTTLAQTVVGSLVYAEDDQTVDETQGTNEPIAGMAVEFVDASTVWVAIGPQYLT